MLYIKLFIEREKNIGQSAPECPFNIYIFIHHNNDVTQKSFGFDFWSCVISTWPWCICPPNFAQIALSNSELLTFSYPRWRPPPSWIFKSCKFGTFCHVNSVVLELYIKFGSNICFSHWYQYTYAPEVHSMTSRELTSSQFRLLVRCSSPHGRGASSHKIWCRYLYPV